MVNIKPSIIQGWHFEIKEYEKAHQENKLIKLVTELSNVCNLSCEGCFTKKVNGSWNKRSKKRLSDEQNYNTQIALIDEADSLSVKTIDIVGAGEPTLDFNFGKFVDYVLGKGKHVVVFTHGASPKIDDFITRWKDENLVFFLKLWSRDPKLQNYYVGNSIENYAEKRDRTLNRLIELEYNSQKNIVVDDIPYQTTKIGADILVMKSNYDEIPDLFRFCRKNNIMPEIKTYIPEGPTRFVQENTTQRYSFKQLEKLRKEELSPDNFLKLRKQLEKIDEEEFGISKLSVVYPQGCKCTQSIGALYVTIQGAIKSCVGSHINYGIYTPKKNMLRAVLEERKNREKVGFGCVPRLEDASLRGIILGKEIKNIYGKGSR